MTRKPIDPADSADTRLPDRPMKRAADYGAGDPTLIPATKVRDIMDRDLILGNFTPGEGQYGPYYRLNLTDPNTGEQIVAYTQHVFVVQWLDQYEPADICPVMVTFYYYDMGKGKKSICIR